MSYSNVQDQYEHTVKIVATSSRGRISTIESPEVGTVSWAMEMSRQNVARNLRYARDDRPGARIWSRVWSSIRARILGIERPWSYWWVQYGRLSDICKTGLMGGSWIAYLEGDVSFFKCRTDEQILAEFRGRSRR